ncbi:TetR/AcrR family transcriptional regulator [Microtetraspora fusca]|uniref:TetR/AcrR family transcriptional regulator n=1 Tax=Microtetraspora fusca TaxID=1997 RepID=UPI000A06BB8B|nr:TetR/AcrR family transcriptional regulator [Microtetraspora fusca]
MMAGRPRTISEDRIMAALVATVGRVGPSRLTLADVAQEAGISTGVLAGRYGSKRALLLGFVRWSLAEERSIRSMRTAFESAADPVEGLIRAVVHSTGPDMGPQEFANHLAFLHLELADDEFRALLGEHDAVVRGELAGYLRSAVASGHMMAGTDVDGLAAAVDSIRNGTQLIWAMTRSQPLAEAIRRDLSTLLAPYRNTKENQ